MGDGRRWREWCRFAVTPTHAATAAPIRGARQAHQAFSQESCIHWRFGARGAGLCELPSRGPALRVPTGCTAAAPRLWHRRSTAVCLPRWAVGTGTSCGRMLAPCGCLVGVRNYGTETSEEEAISQEARARAYNWRRQMGRYQLHKSRDEAPEQGSEAHSDEWGHAACVFSSARSRGVPRGPSRGRGEAARATSK